MLGVFINIYGSVFVCIVSLLFVFDLLADVLVFTIDCLLLIGLVLFVFVCYCLIGGCMQFSCLFRFTLKLGNVVGLVDSLVLFVDLRCVVCVWVWFL